MSSEVNFLNLNASSSRTPCNNIQIEDPSSKYECCICCELLYEPITLGCGHNICSYEFQNIQKCPICRMHIPREMFNSAKPNLLLSNLLQTFFPEKYELRKINVEKMRSNDVIINNYFASEKYRFCSYILMKYGSKHIVVSASELLTELDNKKVNIDIEELLIILSKLSSVKIFQIHTPGGTSVSDQTSVSGDYYICFAGTFFMNHIFNCIRRNNINDEQIQQKLIMCISAYTEIERSEFRLDSSIDTHYLSKFVNQYTTNLNYDNEYLASKISKYHVTKYENTSFKKTFGVLENMLMNILVQLPTVNQENEGNESGSEGGENSDENEGGESSEGESDENEQGNDEGDNENNEAEVNEANQGETTSSENSDDNFQIDEGEQLMSAPYVQLFFS